MNKNVSNVLIIVSFIIILFARIYPYINNDVLLGKDAGIYKYIMESYINSFPNLPNQNIDIWIKANPDPGLFIISDILYLIGFSSDTILKWIFIFFDISVGLGIYVAANKFFEKNVGVIALFIYSISIVQLKVFSYLYYKNVVAIFILLIVIYLFKSGKYIPFILTASFLGGLHRPTFLIFILTYISYILIYRKEFIKNVLAGITIILLALIFYLPYMKDAIIGYIEPIATGNIGSGTFMSLSDYYSSTLYYLPFGLLGLFILIKRKDFNIFFLWFMITGIIVYFKLMFYNRFIIHLDIAVIILAAFGLYEIIKYNKKIGSVLFAMLFILSIFNMVQYVQTLKPLISEKELDIIKNLNNTEKDSFVMTVSGSYGPWILGYSERRTIAPGLFDYDKWTYGEWITFWNTGDKDKAVEMLKTYQKPLYIYIGEKDRINEKKFNNECFNKVFHENRVKIYKFVCG